MLSNVEADEENQDVGASHDEKTHLLFSRSRRITIGAALLFLVACVGLVVVNCSSGINDKKNSEPNDATELYFSSSYSNLGSGFCLDSFGKQPTAYFASDLLGSCRYACSNTRECNGYLLRSAYMAQPGMQGMCILYTGSRPFVGGTWTISVNDKTVGKIHRASGEQVGTCYKKVYRSRCPPSFPTCYVDGDCVLQSCAGGCQWNVNVNYIEGYDGSGRDCDTDF